LSVYTTALEVYVNDTRYWHVLTD